MKVLKNRKCGKAKKGGKYITGTLSPSGTLNPFTALVAPILAEIANPRASQIVSIPQTLEQGVGLWPPTAGDSRYKNLPPEGIADLWGVASGYTTVWDVIEETQNKGICRRVMNYPDLEPPYPVLMMHKDAVWFLPEQKQGGSLDWARVEDWLTEKNDIRLEWSQTMTEQDGTPICHVEDSPWREADSLGHVGDSVFMWHPYIGLYYRYWKINKERRQFRVENDVHFDQGIFGLGWITEKVYCLGEDEDEVPANLAAQGVIAAVPEDDPRAAIYDDEDVWDEKLDW